MPRSRLKNAVLAVSLVALASCTRYALVHPASTVVAGTIDVRPSMAWSRIATPRPGDIGAPELWTIDGERLHALMFIPAVKDGEPLLRPQGGQDKLPTFRADMPIEEVASLFEATLTAATQSSLFRYTSISPATVLGQPGIQMEFTFTGRDEIDREGMAVATIKDGRLYLIAYQGSRLLHYGKYLPEVRKILRSAFIRK